MAKRFLRIDLEYDAPQRYSLSVSDNLKRILAEDMPYVKVAFVRDAPTKEALDEPRLGRSI